MMIDKNNDIKNRPIRSFVLREGRITKSQQKALDQGLPRYGIQIKPGVALELDKLFANKNPIVFEIGFGMGQSLLEMAINNPQINYIGVEVHRPGVGALLSGALEADLHNLRVIRHDAKEVLQENILDGSLDQIQIYFPDPWHKKRHHKRRLIQPDFVALCAKKLRPGGLLHLATDWENYAEHMLQVLSASDQFENTATSGEFVGGSKLRPSTKFEKRGERLGHGVWDLMFMRKG